MQFETIKYMEWIKTKSKAGINLCRSGVEDCSLKDLDLDLDKNKPLIEQKKSMIRKLIKEDRRLSWVEPRGGVVCFPRVETNMSGDRLATLLREKHDTSVVPGSFFENSQHFRLGFGVSPETLARGLENIKKVLDV